MSKVVYFILRPFLRWLPITRLPLATKAARGFVISGAAVLCGFVVMMVAQLAYPASNARPLMHLGGKSVGVKNISAIEQAVNTQNESKVLVSLGSKQYSVSRNDIGVALDPGQVAQQLTSYSLKDRLMPFSLLRKQPDKPIGVKTNHVKLDRFTTKIISDNNIAPVSAKPVRQANGTYKLIPAVEGQRYDPAVVKSSIAEQVSARKTTITLAGTKLPPSVTTAKVKAALAQIDSAAKTNMTVVYAGKTYTIPADTMKTWAIVRANEKTGSVIVTYNSGAIRNWLIRAVPLVVKSPQTSVVTKVDGVVTNRSAAVAGIGLDSTASAAIIAGRLGVKSDNKKVEPIVLKTRVLSPSEYMRKSYTPTSRGLQALINDWQRDHPGVSTSVSFIELGGSGRRAALNPGRLMPSASLYKMFVSWYAMKRIEQGTLSGGQQVVAGKTLNQCIEAMIVLSDNTCGSALGYGYGWSVLDNFAASNGYPSTGLNSSPLTTSSGDMASLLVRLQNNQLLNSTDTNKLIGYMSRQIFRSGIPAGSPGASVADKVGFLDGTWNDAAIVRGKHASYVLVVMTQGGSSATIKDLALRIHNLLE